jgi:hypothetical protein
MGVRPSEVGAREAMWMLDGPDAACDVGPEGTNGVVQAMEFSATMSRGGNTGGYGYKSLSLSHQSYGH